MTKHRKILDGTNDRPLVYDESRDGLLGYACDKENNALAEFDNPADGKFFVEVFNQWPAICDLIEAVEEFKRADEETNKCTELLIFDPCTPKAAEIMQAMYKAKDELFAALDKLNEES